VFSCLQLPVLLFPFLCSNVLLLLLFHSCSYVLAFLLLLSFLRGWLKFTKSRNVLRLDVFLLGYILAPYIEWKVY